MEAAHEPGPTPLTHTHTNTSHRHLTPPTPQPPSPQPLNRTLLSTIRSIINFTHKTKPQLPTTATHRQFTSSWNTHCQLIHSKLTQLTKHHNTSLEPASDPLPSCQQRDRATCTPTTRPLWLHFNYEALKGKLRQQAKHILPHFYSQPQHNNSTRHLILPALDRKNLISALTHQLQLTQEHHYYYQEPPPTPPIEPCTPIHTLPDPSYLSQTLLLPVTSNLSQTLYTSDITLQKRLYTRDYIKFPYLHQPSMASPIPTYSFVDPDPEHRWPDPPHLPQTQTSLGHLPPQCIHLPRPHLPWHPHTLAACPSPGLQPKPTPRTSSPAPSTSTRP